MSSFNDSVVFVNYLCDKCGEVSDILFKDNSCPHCPSEFIGELANADTLGLTGAEGGEALNDVHVDADQCSICLDDMESPQKVLKCKHVYHKKCITDWFHNNNRCPLCREAVDPSTVLTPNFRSVETLSLSSDNDSLGLSDGQYPDEMSSPESSSEDSFLIFQPTGRQLLRVMIEIRRNIARRSADSGVLEPNISRLVLDLHRYFRERQFSTTTGAYFWVDF